MGGGRGDPVSYDPGYIRIYIYIYIVNSKYSSSRFSFKHKRSRCTPKRLHYFPFQQSSVQSRPAIGQNGLATKKVVNTPPDQMMEIPDLTQERPRSNQMAQVYECHNPPSPGSLSQNRLWWKRFPKRPLTKDALLTKIRLWEFHVQFTLPKIQKFMSFCHGEIALVQFGAT